MKTTRLLLSTLLLLAAAVATAPAVSQAQTPDGQTPAEEDVCDELSGAAFGLCNAYCEAMDCELFYDDDPETTPSASEVACLKVKDNFIKITGEAELPCEVDECPAGTLDCPCRTEEPECDEGLICGEGTMTCEDDGNGN